MKKNHIKQCSRCGDVFDFAEINEVFGEGKPVVCWDCSTSEERAARRIKERALEAAKTKTHTTECECADSTKQQFEDVLKRLSTLELIVLGNPNGASGGAVPYDFNSKEK
jgi:hypothetical protein